MNKSGIYEICNVTNGHFYIGSAIDIARRWRTHRRLLRNNKHHNSYLQNAWVRYGEGAFKFSVIEFCSKQELLLKEQEYLDLRHPVYNISLIAGSRLGVKQSDKAKKTISDALKGRTVVSWNKGKKGVYSNETLQKMSLARMGMSFSDEHKSNISKSRKGKPSNWKGKTPSEETRKRMSDSHKGKIPWNKGKTKSIGDIV